MGKITVTLEFQWGEPIPVAELRKVGIEVATNNPFVVFIPAERPDLAEELSPGSTHHGDPRVLPDGQHVWILDIPTDRAMENHYARKYH